MAARSAAEHVPGPPSAVDQLERSPAAGAGAPGRPTITGPAGSLLVAAAFGALSLLLAAGAPLLAKLPGEAQLAACVSVVPALRWATPELTRYDRVFALTSVYIAHSASGCEPRLLQLGAAVCALVSALHWLHYDHRGLHRADICCSTALFSYHAVCGASLPAGERTAALAAAAASALFFSVRKGWREKGSYAPSDVCVHALFRFFAYVLARLAQQRTVSAEAFAAYWLLHVGLVAVLE